MSLRLYATFRARRPVPRMRTFLFQRRSLIKSLLTATREMGKKASPNSQKRNKTGRE